ncbi:MAG TPA: PEGA domain-containing protein, partial [Kofleriaceae bacterium]
SLVSTARGWDGPRAGSTTNPGNNGSSVSPPPSVLASGSSKSAAPAAPPADDPFAALAASYSAPPASARDLPAPRGSEPMFDPMASFGSGMLGRAAGSGRKGKGMLWIAIGGAAVAVVAVVIVIAMTGGDKKPNAPVASVDQAPATTPGAQPAVAGGDQNTGFDLYVQPPGTMTWRLDGEARTDKLPSRIRGISPGQHTVAIDAPPGFMSQNMPISVEVGKAPKVEIILQPLDIAGEFESTPPGATVSLIVDGKRETVGPSPAKMKLDPRKTYQVLFEKPGFVSINRPIVFTGGVEEKVAVTLEKAGGSTAVAAAAPVQTPVVKAEPKEPKLPKVAKVEPKEPKVEPKETKVEPKETKVEPKEAKVEPTPASAKGQGTLLLGSKPPCDIYIDGKDTGMQTPQRDIKLASGKHKITLVNNEFGIKETFAVDIKADATEKQIKDYSDRIPK